MSYDNFPFERISIPELEAQFFERGVAHIQIDPNANYRLLFERRENYEEIVGQEGRHLAEVPGTPSYDFKKSYRNAPVYTGEELQDGLDIDVHAYNRKLRNWDRFPIVHDRDDPMNGEWVPFSSGDILILRLVHSYPNGNMTSFYRETRIYFKRIN